MVMKNIHELNDFIPQHITQHNREQYTTVFTNFMVEKLSKQFVTKTINKKSSPATVTLDTSDESESEETALEPSRVKKKARRFASSSSSLSYTFLADQGEARGCSKKHLRN